jgi:DNA (cytosine-5)-methyltransferase 1
MFTPAAILDLFCGAGGAAMGLHRAWPEAEIVGVDLTPQPRYPFEFVQADALEFPLDGYDFIWLQGMNGTPYIIENVVGAPLVSPVTVCGLALGLKVKRHRLFESNRPLRGTVCPSHDQNYYVIFGHECRNRRHGAAADRKNRIAVGRAAMGIDWMTRGELSQAIPPAYSEFLARQL